MIHSLDSKQKTGQKKSRFIRWQVILTLLIVALVVAGVHFFKVGEAKAPEMLRQKIIASVNQSCPLCKIEIGSVDIALDLKRVRLNHLKFSDDHKGHTLIDLKAERIEVQISNSIASLLEKKISAENPLVLTEVKVTRLDFTLTEDPAVKSSADDGSQPLSELPPAVVEKVGIEDSIFHYVDLLKPKPSSLTCSQINGEIGGFATRRLLSKEYSVERTSMHGTGVFDRSGHFNLKIDADVLSQKGTVDIDVEVKDQPLEAAAQFFSREAKIGLKGQIGDVRGELSMREGKIRAKITAAYKDLSVKSVDPKASGLKKALTNIGASIVISHQKGEDGKPAGSATVEDQRNPDQGLVAAIFHALAGAAKKLVTN